VFSPFDRIINQSNFIVLIIEIFVQIGSFAFMMLIDTHAHIYLPEFETERQQLIIASQQKKVQKILMPAIDAATHSLMLDVEKNFDNCRAMMGLHPCSVNAEYQTELQIVDEWLQRRSFIAIGEIGLDFHWDKTFVQQQYETFHQQIQWAIHYDLPIVIHSRNATDECIEVVKQYPKLRGVFHCFSGTIDQGKAVIELGFLLGIGGVVTFKNAGLDKVVETLGIEDVILETDSPYLAPVPYRGKRNECSYLHLVAEKIAFITGKPLEEVARITSQNAIKLFNL
jgi:TatD DNase family protein